MRFAPHAVALLLTAFVATAPVVVAAAGCGSTGSAAEPERPSSPGVPSAGPSSGAADAGPPLEWPNAESRAVSDPWIAEHHDAITKMRPRVLAVNFDDDPKTRDKFHENVLAVAAGLSEGSRYHGYASKDAPKFLEYEVSEWVDLADVTPPPGWSHKISSRIPFRCVTSAGYNFDYGKLVKDLDVCKKLESGAIHEVWIYMNGDPDPIPCPDGTPTQVGALEIVESKPIYDAKGKKRPGLFENCAGNGCISSDDTPAFFACDRTVRVLFLNSTRGPGCAIHSAGHGYEQMAQSKAVPDLGPRFQIFGNFDLKERLKLPFSDWYACDLGAKDCVTFTGPNSLTWKVKGATGTVASYDQHCGNVHFAPNSGAHYDEGPTEVLSTCESFGLGGGEGGRDKPELFSNAKYAQYQAMAPDCGGAWQIYWRQSFPGLANQAKDAAGRPMRNWWPYVYY